VSEAVTSPVPPAPLGHQSVPELLPPPVLGSTEPSTAPADPVIGPQLAAARARLRLSVDDLAERTRIRPHVIEAIEVDDFSACGGDVYARGHVRALSRMLGIDADPLVAAYDARYASAPVTARRVFEAELAGPGRALRPTSGGPRWSILIGVVLVLVLVWGLARLLVPAPAEDGGGDGRSDRGSQQSGSAGTTADSVADTEADAGAAANAAAERFASMGQRQTMTLLTLSAASGTTTQTPVVVRAADGSVAFRGTIDPGSSRTVRVPGPATVITPDAGAVLAGVDGGESVPLGERGVPARTTFGD
jgi:cytoskeletal protein RodZ